MGQELCLHFVEAQRIENYHMRVRFSICKMLLCKKGSPSVSEEAESPGLSLEPQVKF